MYYKIITLISNSIKRIVAYASGDSFFFRFVLFLLAGCDAERGE